MNTLMVVVLGFALVVGGIAAYAHWIGNPGIVRQLQEDPGGSVAAKVMLLTLPDGRRLPVNYLREGTSVYAGADGPWWRGLRDGSHPVTLLIQGETLNGQARAIEGDRERTRDVFTRLRNTPKWLPEWADAVLVEIRIEPDQG